MEIEVTQTTKVKKEVDLPYFSKTSIHYYKVISEKRCLMVHDGSDSCAIEERFYSSCAFNDDCTQCTEQEFVDAFDKVMNRLTQLYK